MKILDSLQVKRASLEQIGHPREFEGIHEYLVAVGSTCGGRADQVANMCLKSKQSVESFSFGT